MEGMLRTDKRVGRPPTYTPPRPRYQSRSLSLPRTHWDFLESLRDRRQDPTVSDTVRSIINMVKEQIEQPNEPSATNQAAQINRTQRPTTLM